MVQLCHACPHSRPQLKTPLAATVKAGLPRCIPCCFSCSAVATRPAPTPEALCAPFSSRGQAHEDDRDMFGESFEVTGGSKVGSAARPLTWVGLCVLRQVCAGTLHGRLPLCVLAARATRGQAGCNKLHHLHRTQWQDNISAPALTCLCGPAAFAACGLHHPLLIAGSALCPVPA